MAYNSIEDALRSKSKPCTYKELSKLTGISSSCLCEHLCEDNNLYALILENKAARRTERLEMEIATIEAKAKELGVSGSKAGVLLGGYPDYYAKCKRKLAGKVERVSKNKKYLEEIVDALNNGAVTVLDAAKMKGIPRGSATVAVNDNEEVKRLVRANRDARLRVRYQEACDKIKARIDDKGETVSVASKALGYDTDIYHRARRFLGIEVGTVGKKRLRSAYNRLLMGKLTGQSSVAG